MQPSLCEQSQVEGQLWFGLVHHVHDLLEVVAKSLRLALELLLGLHHHPAPVAILAEQLLLLFFTFHLPSFEFFRRTHFFKLLQLLLQGKVLIFDLGKTSICFNFKLPNLILSVNSSPKLSCFGNSKPVMSLLPKKPSTGTLRKAQNNSLRTQLESNNLGGQIGQERFELVASW